MPTHEEASVGSSCTEKGEDYAVFNRVGRGMQLETWHCELVC